MQSIVYQSIGCSPIFPWVASNGGGGTVAIGIDPLTNIRGLLAQEPADKGDVLLEVPLALCLSDFGATTPVATEPPAFAKDLPWNVQLTCAVLAMPPASEMAVSWPEAPVLPIFAADQVEQLACDKELARSAVSEYSWCDEQHVACTAAADEHGAVPPPIDAFRDAMALVWSRALRIRGPRDTGLRRLLVPALDLANHAETPSAIYAFSPTNGGVVRLHAARRIEAGQAVTINYADDLSSSHFALYYGFVPHSNAADAVELPLTTILAGAPAPPRDGGDENAAWTESRLADAGVEPSQLFKLHAKAPSLVLLTTLRSLLAGEPVRDPASLTCTGCSGVVAGFGDGEDDALAATTLRIVADAAQTEAKRLEDAARGDEGGEVATLLLALRGRRIALLDELVASMMMLADRFDAGGGAAASARVLLECAVMEAEPKPYPIAPRLLEQWCAQAWDWEKAEYA